MKNIKNVVITQKCCSCGICAGVCAKDAIFMEINKRTGEPFPRVNETRCVDCGACLNVCPGLSCASLILTDTPKEHQRRQCSHLEAWVGSIKDSGLLINCTSGGIVSELVRTLLSDSVYESAFLVNTNQYADLAESERTTLHTPSSSKSRYVAISHEKAVKYILSHRDERIIIIAVSCAINGFRNLFRQYHLNSDNYLLVGLFCDKIMTYQIWDYFCSAYSSQGVLTGLDFRNKLESGWPGDIRLYFNNASMFAARKERMLVKKFFQSERCLYCTDKLNESSDISVGDDYTGSNTSTGGRSSIIIRTSTGKRALDAIRNKCTLAAISIDELYTSQHVGQKQKNIRYARLKYRGMLHSQASFKDILSYAKAKTMIKIGRSYCKAPVFLHIALKVKKFISSL